MLLMGGRLCNLTFCGEQPNCYSILSSKVRTFDIKNDAEIYPAHYTWKVTEKGFKMAFMINKLAMINSCEIIIEKYK